MRRNILYLLVVLICVVTALGAIQLLQRPPIHAHASTPGDWPEFMGDMAHTGNNSSESIINPTTAHQLPLTPTWQFTTGSDVLASPVIVGGVMYVGSWDGNEYAINLSTHQQIWKQFLGITQQSKPCYGGGSVGVTSTASVQNGTVYVGGGDGNMYALNSTNGSVLWKHFLDAPPYYIFSSPLVYNNRVYVGESAFCDPPGTQGKFVALNISDGSVAAGPALLVPNGQIGAGVWSSPALDTANNRLYITTGNLAGATLGSQQPYAEAFVALDATTLAIVDHWQIPTSDQFGDADFGASPTLFDVNGVGYVGSENKNGYFYALNRTNLAAGAVWKQFLDGTVPNPLTPTDNDSTPCFSNGTLYVGAGPVNGSSSPTYNGSIHALNPLTGAQLWGFGTVGPMQASISCTSNGLVVDAQGSTVEIRAASSGSVLFHVTLGNRIQGTPIISNGVLYVPSRDHSIYAFALAGTPSPSPSPSPPPNTPPGPVNKTWYFGEGRVGSGFREYLSIDNPTVGSTCTANIKYLYTVEGTTTPQSKVVTVPVPATSRVTESVNTDLNTADSITPALAVSTIVTVNGSTPTCPGFMVERPVYFTNYHGLSSGTDVVGSTHLGTTFSFADVPSGSGATSFITILNPGTITATVTISYYANGAKVGSQSLPVAAGARGTIAPGNITLPAHSAAIVTSTQPVVVERPTYYFSANGMPGAADVVGVQSSGNDWLFAEGYAASNSRETLTISNLDPTVSAAVTVTLKSKTGVTNSTPVTVAAQSQLVFDVNGHDTFAGSSPEVSAEVKATSGNGVVVQREMYYQYTHSLSNGTLSTNSISDVVGLPATSVKSSYSFAEGYTRTDYHEWLTVQNPTATNEIIYVTLVNGNKQTFVRSFSAPANGRLTIDITAQMQQAGIAPADNQGNTVSMTVQTLNNGGNFIAERPSYFNTTGTSFAVKGGTDIIGYLGG
ncbi:MAG: hypothetical protein NVS4B11_00060 [Ktedonobacteraceae bacterium]